MTDKIREQLKLVRRTPKLATSLMVDADEIEAMLDVIDAAKEIANGPHKNWPKLRKAIAKLEDDDEHG